MDVSDEAEKAKFFNFLKHYDLSEYHDSFLKHGVRKLSHLKHTTDEDLKEIGLRRPEITRLKRKMEENFSKLGKIKKRFSRKERLFDGHVTDEVGVATGNSPGLLPNLIGSDQIQLLDKIGEGAHGAVHKAIVSLNGTKLQVAAKCIVAVNESSLQSQFMKEAESMIQLNHQHIIKLYGISIGTPLMIIEELAPLGNLNVFLRTSPTKIHFGKLYTYMLQVASAMRYLENKKMIHRDLATRNVLLITEDHVKLSDFGLARKLTESSDYKLTRTDVPLPISWMSPEAINDGIFSTASDVFSYGVFVWELLSDGAKPWKGYRTIEIKERLETGERLRQPRICSPKLYQLISTCWSLDPKERPTFSELFKKLHEPQYRPEVALVTTAHTLEGEQELKKGDLLFVLDRRRKDLWVGMTLDGEVVSFQKDCVTCDSMRMRDPHGDNVIQFDPNIYQTVNDNTDHYETRYNNPGILDTDQTPPQVVTVNDNTDHYETRYNNPGIFDKGTVSEHTEPLESSSTSDFGEDTYISMKGQSILDTPTEADLPPPIVPTAEALHNLMISAETKNIYSDIDEDDDRSPDVESTYCVIKQSNFDNSPPPIPPRKSFSDSNPDSPSFRPPIHPRSNSFKPSHEHILDTLLQEFPDIAPDMCTRLVRKYGNNIDRTRNELKVCQLMSMGFPYIEEKDCIRALNHCQGKTERAAVWLLEMSETIGTQGSVSV